MLSGGERNRLLLARLFARPANILVLDEPTNDLDIESLELLEQTLQEYRGTLLLVSHDRTFLDNVVTQTLAPDGDGRWKEYVGGYSDWLRQRSPRIQRSTLRIDRRRVTGIEPPSCRRRPAKPKACGSKAQLQGKRATRANCLSRIEALEAEQRALTVAMSGADYHKRGGEQMRKDAERATAIEARTRDGVRTLGGTRSQAERSTRRAEARLRPREPLAAARGPCPSPAPMGAARVHPTCRGCARGSAVRRSARVSRRRAACSSKPLSFSISTPLARSASSTCRRR